MNLTVLSSWKPRPPGAGLKARIFAERALAPEHKSLSNLLVPAAACLMLTLWVMNSGSPLSASNHGLIGSLSLSNLSYSAFGTGGSQNAQNHMDSLTFASTNRGAFSSPVGFTSTTN